MSWNFWKKPAPRVRVTSNEVAAAVTRALGRSMSCTPRISDDFYTLTTKDEVKRIAGKAWEPWVEETDDCDDQALAVKHHANREAWNLGLREPLAIGFMWSAGAKPHAYTIAILAGDGHALSAPYRAAFYNQTTGFWETLDQLDKPITLVVI